MCDRQTQLWPWRDMLQHQRLLHLPVSPGFSEERRPLCGWVVVIHRCKTHFLVSLYHIINNGVKLLKRLAFRLLTSFITCVFPQTETSVPWPTTACTDVWTHRAHTTVSATQVTSWPATITAVLVSHWKAMCTRVSVCLCVQHWILKTVCFNALSFIGSLCWCGHLPYLLNWKASFWFRFGNMLLLA